MKRREPTRLQWKRLLRRRAPLLLAALVYAAQPVDARLVEQHREIAESVGAKFTILRDGGLFVGFGMMRMMRGSSGPIISLTIAADTFNFVIRTQAVAAGWDTVAPPNITTTVNSGIWVGDNTNSNAMDTGFNYPATTALYLVNNGTIGGKGGNGGGGGAGGGTAGSLALNITYSLVIDNTNGYIRGGGGGGGGGGSYNTGGAQAGGGGGGGGRGFPGGTAGAGAAIGNPGSAGAAGTKTGSGTGGGGGHDSFYGVDGGGGGQGGNSGLVGATGNASTSNQQFGGTGGAAGAATYRQDITITTVVTWTGGHNGSQVLGAEL